MQRRAAIGVAFLIWTLFIVADWLMVDIRLHPNLFEQLLGVRLGMIGLLLVVWPAAFLPSLRKVGDAIAPYCLLLINLAVLACDVLFEWHGVPRFTQLGATLGILAVFFPRPGVLGLRAPGVAVPGPEPGGIPALRRRREPAHQPAEYALQRPGGADLFVRPVPAGLRPARAVPRPAAAGHDGRTGQPHRPGQPTLLRAARPAGPGAGRPRKKGWR
ncbi:hypothetical protein P4054_16485 [Pseudomonas aeruginosa]|nr:hypothetical protein [Pseudomonas aeruginosa]